MHPAEQISASFCSSRSLIDMDLWADRLRRPHVEGLRLDALDTNGGADSPVRVLALIGTGDLRSVLYRPTRTGLSALPFNLGKEPFSPPCAQHRLRVLTSTGDNLLA